MTKEERLLLVNEGFTLDQRIKLDEKRLDEIKDILAGAANGVRAEFLGTDCKVEIAFHPTLSRTLEAEDEGKAKEIAGSFFEKLFCRSPIAKFKDVANALLGEDGAKPLIRLLSGPKSPRVSFKKD